MLAECVAEWQLHTEWAVECLERAGLCVGSVSSCWNLAGGMTALPQLLVGSPDILLGSLRVLMGRAWLQLVRLGSQIGPGPTQKSPARSWASPWQFRVRSVRSQPGSDRSKTSALLTLTLVGQFTECFVTLPKALLKTL